MHNKRNSIAIASLGTLIEYYDYSIFSLFLPFIAPVFFPGDSDYKALVAGFYAVLIASVARPFGGFFFGWIGDKYGRKAALVISIYGIAFATLAVGFLPGYLTIGIVASLLVILIRSVQMLCYGGEYSGAGIYVVEIAHKSRAGLMGSLPSAMALSGSVMASLVGLLLTFIDKASPCWRFGFIFGGVMGLLAIYFRRSMVDSVSSAHLSRQVPFIDIMKRFPLQLLAGFCVGGVITTPFTTVMSFVNPLFVSIHVLTPAQFMWIQLSISSAAVVTLLCSGFLADRTSPVKVMIYASCCIILFAYPLAELINSRIIFFVVTSEIALVMINELLFGPSNAYLKELFPANCRYRGVAFSFCLGMSVFGGLTPVVENYLMEMTGNIVGIAWWIMGAGAFMLIVLSVVRPADDQP